MDGSVRLWDLADVREREAFTDNQGPVSAVMFLYDGELIVSASFDGTVRVRSTRTGRLLRSFEGGRRSHVDLALGSSEGGTMQISLGEGLGCPVLARGPDSESVLVGSSQGTAQLRLVRPDTPKAPPRIHTGLVDPYSDFEDLYRSVGLRIARDGPSAGQVMLA
jgi:WD40 repeat protein